MKIITGILAWLGFLGFAACFNIVFFCWWDLVTMKEVIAVFSLGGITTAITGLINSILIK